MAMEADPQLESAAEPGTEETPEATSGGEHEGSANVGDSGGGEQRQDEDGKTISMEAYKGLQRKLEQYAPLAPILKQASAQDLAKWIDEFGALVQHKELGPLVQRWRAGEPVSLPKPRTEEDELDEIENPWKKELEERDRRIEALESRLKGEVQGIAKQQVKQRVTEAMQGFFSDDLYRYMKPEERQGIEEALMPRFETYMATDQGLKQLAELTKDNVEQLAYPELKPILPELVKRMESNRQKQRSGKATDAPFSAATTGREARAEGEPAQSRAEARDILLSAIREARG